MTAFRARPLSLTWLAAALFVTAYAGAARAAEPIEVALDQATVVKVPGRAATIVIGDPLIADLSLQSGGIAVVTGKAFGATNIIVMDHDGAVLMEKNIEVRGPTDQVVVVYRGEKRQTYSCTPECMPRITLGDDRDYFAGVLQESSERNTAAVAAAAQAQAGNANRESEPKQ